MDAKRCKILAMLLFSTWPLGGSNPTAGIPTSGPPAGFRCFPASTHRIHIKWISSLIVVLHKAAKDALIWIRCVGAVKHLKPAGEDRLSDLINSVTDQRLPRYNIPEMKVIPKKSFIPLVNVHHSCCFLLGQLLLLLNFNQFIHFKASLKMCESMFFFKDRFRCALPGNENLPPVRGLLSLQPESKKTCSNVHFLFTGSYSVIGWSPPRWLTCST